MENTKPHLILEQYGTKYSFGHSPENISASHAMHLLRPLSTLRPLSGAAQMTFDLANDFLLADVNGTDPWPRGPIMNHGS